MAWTDSRIFTQAIKNPMTRAVDATTAPTGFTSLVATDVIAVTLWGTGITPDKDATVANTGYNTGVWASGANEIKDATNWPAGGASNALASKTYTAVTGAVQYDAADRAGNGNVTLSAAFGCLVHDDTITAGTVAKQGMCFNYFGGSQSVTAGTFCADAATEILTRRGWLRHDQVRQGDICLTLNASTGLAEWQPVDAVHVFTDGPYDVIRLAGAGHSSVTTPDHRWPAVTPAADGITWYTTQTLPPDAQLLISESERTDKVVDLAVTHETAGVVWCVQTPNQTWCARRAGTSYFTGNTIIWDATGVFKFTN